MYGHDAGRTSHTPARELPATDAEASRFSETGLTVGSGGSVNAPPVVGDGVAYVAGDTRIEAREIETGNRLWETDPEDGVEVSPVLGCGAVYVSTLNETLALDRADGSVLWRTDAGVHSGKSSAPVLVDDTLYLGSGSVVALDAATGSRRWTGSPANSVQGVAVADRIYAGMGSNGTGGVAAFTTSGDTWWETTRPGEVYTAPAVADGTVYAVSKTGTLTALAGGDGRVEWQASIESGVYQPPAVADGRVFVGAGNGTQTLAFDADSGDRLWTFETGVSTSAPTVVSDRVLTSGANTGIFELDAATGERRSHWAVDKVGSQPVVAGGKFLYRAWNYSDINIVG